MVRSVSAVGTIRRALGNRRLIRRSASVATRPLRRSRKEPRINTDSKSGFFRVYLWLIYLGYQHQQPNRPSHALRVARRLSIGCLRHLYGRSGLESVGGQNAALRRRARDYSRVLSVRL